MPPPTSRHGARPQRTRPTERRARSALRTPLRARDLQRDRGRCRRCGPRCGRQRSGELLVAWREGPRR
ncbi:hypothetical protein [Ornithinimicrobium kibberense]|uniref:hypothetical protein n=1 Tax=Ornithinimicrobium kibberense TaxID=282060 RepID=UPI00361B3A44